MVDSIWWWDFDQLKLSEQSLFGHVWKEAKLNITKTYEQEFSYRIGLPIISLPNKITYSHYAGHKGFSINKINTLVVQKGILFNLDQSRFQTINLCLYDKNVVYCRRIHNLKPLNVDPSFLETELSVESEENLLFICFSACEIE